MRDIVILAIHFLSTVLKLIRPGGTRSVVAESLLLKHQPDSILEFNRSCGSSISSAIITMMRARTTDCLARRPPLRQ
jgi:hypothetical protein